MCRAPLQLLEAEIDFINAVPTYGTDEIHATSRTIGIVFLRMSSSIRLSTLGLSTVYGLVLELGAAALHDFNADGGCSDKSIV
jgi:hypothetical protein